jgi:hypothetical protein
LELGTLNLELGPSRIAKQVWLEPADLALVTIDREQRGDMLKGECPESEVRKYTAARTVANFGFKREST